MFDLVLINPYTSFLEDDFYLPSLTSNLLQSWLSNRVPYFNIDVINMNEVGNDFTKIKPARYYGISFTTPHVPEVNRIYKYLKYNYRDSVVVGGGILFDNGYIQVDLKNPDRAVRCDVVSGNDCISCDFYNGFLTYVDNFYNKKNSLKFDTTDGIDNSIKYFIDVLSGIRFEDNLYSSVNIVKVLDIK